MDSPQNIPSTTPRRSTRLLQCGAVTPKSESKSKIHGPRMMMKLNKSLNKSKKLDDAEVSHSNVVEEKEAIEEEKMELDEIEEYQKPKAKTSSKRGRKTKKTNHTKSLSEPSEISHDEKSNIIESDSSPDVIDTTKIAKNMSLNNVIIDESLALEPPEKSSIDLVDAKIIKAELQETENLIQTKNDVIKNVLNVEKDEKKEPNVEENKIIVDKSSTNVVNVLIPVAIVEVVEAPTISVVEDGVLKVPQNQDENIEPVEEMDSTHEVQDEALIITSVEQVEKIAPVEAINCSEEVQDVAPMINVKCEKTEEIERIVEVQDSTPMIVGKDEKLQPGMKNNKNEMLEKLTVIKKEKETPENVPEKSPIKLVTRKSESYTIEETENTVERCESPDLMDESIVTIMDSPSMNASVLPKDSTFSPVVDISINDSRPTIDIPLLKRNNPLRTSTPLAPKLGLKSSETLNSKRKLMLNPLEKSILKSNHRKRSLSMTAGDSVMQKRVMFISPTVMDIESIDHKMMASFIEEKENSIMVTAAASGRRKRSMSETSTTPRAKIVSRVKIPNFNKLHEKQFQKMEDIAEFTKRKADRARKLATPTKPAAVPKAEVPIVVTKKDQLSKIPTFKKKPLASEMIIEKTIMKEYKSISNRLGKRSNSMGIEKKGIHETFASKKVFKSENPEKNAPGLATRMKPKTTSSLIRSNSENTQQNRQVYSNPLTSTFNPKNFDSKLAFSFLNNKDIATNIKKEKSKMQERHDKNIQLSKKNGFNPQEQRKKNDNLLVGVRKNRRFELQMQFRAKQEHEHNIEDK